MNPLEKIVSLEQLEIIVSKLKAQGKKIVQSHGVFDLVHPGHILHFKAARKLGDMLVVTLTKDEYVRKGPGRPYFNQRLRLETIAALEYVDYVALNEWPTAIEAIKKLKPNYYAKGKDYADNSKDVTGNILHEVNAIKEMGGEIVYTDEEMFSSSKLLNRFMHDYPPHVKTFLDDFRHRHNAEEIVAQLKSLSDLNVMVVGEAILDQYYYCQALGKPPKDPIVSSKYLSHEDFAGGTVAMANHLANFCKNVTLLTYVGDDGRDKYFRSKIADNVKFIPVVVEDKPTVTKRRFLDPSFLTKMFEVQYINDEELSGAVEQKVIDEFNFNVQDQDMVVIGDFGHGMITPNLKEIFYNSGKFLALNTQSNSANMGFNPVTKYKRANYVSIDEPELRFASHSRYGDIEKIALDIKKRLEIQYLMISRGPYGSVLFAEGNDKFEAPALSGRIIDRTGAGDALFSVTAPCLYRGVDPEIVCFISNCVGAMAVETVCNREPIDPAILYKFITYILK